MYSTDLKPHCLFINVSTHAIARDSAPPFYLLFNKSKKKKLPYNKVHLN